MIGNYVLDDILSDAQRGLRLRDHIQRVQLCYYAFDLSDIRFQFSSYVFDDFIGNIEVKQLRLSLNYREPCFILGGFTSAVRPELNRVLSLSEMDLISFAGRSEVSTIALFCV